MDTVYENEIYMHPNRSSAIRQVGHVSKVGGRMINDGSLLALCGRGPDLIHRPEMRIRWGVTTVASLEAQSWLRPRGRLHTTLPEHANAIRNREI